MAHPVPTEELTEVAIGDLVTWKRTLANYPASTWTLTYYLRSDTGADAETFAATADGDDHLVSVAAATTASWVAGTYYWTALVSSGSERYKIDEGVIAVVSNPAVTTTDDDRSNAKKILDALEAVAIARASRPEKSYSIAAAGRNFQFHSHEELIKAIDDWRSKVKQEADAALIAKGKPLNNQILVRF